MKKSKIEKIKGDVLMPKPTKLEWKNESFDSSLIIKSVKSKKKKSAKKKSNTDNTWGKDIKVNWIVKK